MHDRERARALGLSTGPPEDTVFYEVYLDRPGSSEEDLAALRKQCLQTAESYTHNYIWQKGGFNLRQAALHLQPWLKAAEPCSSQERCLWGQTSFGDNIEDEWLVAWILLQLTRQNDKLTARVWDTDGEFLLIEAAYALPPWLSPESSSERLWLRGGALHLIPPQSADHPTLPLAPNTAQALQILQSSIDTLAPSRMQAAVAARLSRYPQQAEDSMHYAAAILPCKLAGVLQRDPHLVAPAVLAFHYREPQDVKIAHEMIHFPAEAMVETVVKFSRCLYAQLVTQHYETPLDFPVPLPSEPGFPAAQLGAKLTAGFELLLTRASDNPSQGDARTSQGNPGALRDVEGNPAWQPFMQTLADQGFFGEERIGSRSHDDLLLTAAQRFRQTAQYTQYRALEREPAERVLSHLQAGCLFDPSKVKGKPQSDAWLAQGEEEIEKQLRQRQGERDAAEEKEPPAADPVELAERFKDFLSRESGLDGADIGTGLYGAQGSRQGEDRESVDLDEQEFWREMKHILQIQGQHGAGKAMSDSEGSSFYGDYSDDGSVGGDSHTMSTKHVRKCAGPSAASTPSKLAQPRRTFDDRFSPGSAEGMSTRNHDSNHSSSPRRARRREREDGPSMSTCGREAHDEEEDWDVATATDSDDDADYFEAAYDEALKAQMREANIFNPAERPTANNDGEGEEPVDLDMNLVQNLLVSYEAQEGLPGPVGNLFGMMGLHLPTEKPDSQFRH